MQIERSEEFLGIFADDELKMEIGSLPVWTVPIETGSLQVMLAKW